MVDINTGILGIVGYPLVIPFRPYSITALLKKKS